MLWRKATGLALVMLALGGAALTAQRAALADAAEHRDRAAVRRQLASGADVNGAQPDGTTALHWAVYNDDADTATLLVKKGANVNAANRYRMTPLAMAATNGNSVLVRLLLDAGADVNTTMKGEETALMLAARSGSVDAVKALLARGAKPDAREVLGQTALMWAAAEGHASVVRALIDGGADSKVTLASGFTAFLFAVREGRIEVARALLETGIDVNAPLQRPATAGTGSVTPNVALLRPVPRGLTPLLLAVQNGHFELAIALVDAGANPNDTQMGFAPLHMISSVRKPDSSDGSDPSTPTGSGRLTSLQFVREIVKRGANVNLRVDKGAARFPGTSSRVDVAGATPFLFATDRADLPLMRLLLELGADPLMPNLSNQTPLLVAAGVGTKETVEEAGEEVEMVEAVKLLLDLGADINAVDNNGDTAMHGAAFCACPALVRLLAERGADPKIWSQPNKTGRTPLFLAEGFTGGEPEPDVPTIEAVTKLMLAAGLSTEGQRPVLVDQYARPAGGRGGRAGTPLGAAPGGGRGATPPAVQLPSPTPTPRVP